MRDGGGRARGGRQGGRLWALVLLAVVGCDNFVSYRLWDGKPRFLPYPGIKGVGETVTLTVEQGKRPYSFALVAGKGSIQAVGDSQVEYSAPAAPTLARIRVTDALASSAEAEIQVVGDSLVITPSPVDDLQVGESVTLAASGGAPPYAFSLVAGDGAVDANSGVYTAPGVPTAATVRVTDSLNDTADAVIHVWLPLGISPDSAYVQTGSSAGFAASGGKPPYQYTVASGGGNVTADGIYHAPDNPGDAVVRATDGRPGRQADAQVTVYAPLVIDPADVPVPPGGTLSFTASGGVPPLSFTVSEGYGGAIDPATGAYQAPSGEGEERVTVTDSKPGTPNTAMAIVHVRLPE